MSQIFAVGSGKGGVGKTWLSVTLAHALAMRGRRVLLFDGDFGLANIDVQLGLLPGRMLDAVLAGQTAVEEAVIEHPAGFALLAGRSGSGTLADLEPLALARLLQGLRGVAAAYDAVILDLSAGVDRSVRRMAAFADTLLVVATEDPTSLTDAYALMKLHAQGERGGGADVRVVVNQAAGAASGARVQLTLARACRGFLGTVPRAAGVIRRDDHVRDAIRHQAPLLTRHPGCNAATDLTRVADGLLGDRGALKAARAAKG